MDFSVGGGQKTQPRKQMGREERKNMVLSKGSVQFSSVTQLYPTLCDPMDCGKPGFPVYRQLPQLTQTHVHRVDEAIEPSHPLSSPFSSCPQSFPASGSFPMSQFFASGG